METFRETPLVPLLNATACEEYKDLKTLNERLRYIQKVVHVEHYESNPRSRLYVQYLFHALSSMQEVWHWDLSISVWMLSILNQTFEHMTTTPFPSLDICYQYFAHMIEISSQQNPTIFTLDRIEKLVSYATMSLFRHHAAYQYVYSQNIQFQRQQVPLAVDEPIIPLPLNHAQVLENQ